jgi:hypothetical protein
MSGSAIARTVIVWSNSCQRSETAERKWPRPLATFGRLGVLLPIIVAFILVLAGSARMLNTSAASARIRVTFLGIHFTFFSGRRSS